MTTLSLSDNGRVVRLPVGTSFALHLEENATTGHKWTTPTFDKSILTLDKDDTAPPTSHAAPGAGGSRDFEFRVTGVGTTKIELAYHRSWEGDAAGESQYSVTIVATA